MFGAAARLCRILAAPEIWSRDKAFSSMVTELSQLFLLDIYHLPAKMRDAQGRFYSSMDSAVFVVARTMEEAAFHQASRGIEGDAQTLAALELGERVLTRLFGRQAWNVLRSNYDLRFELHPKEAAAERQDAKLLTRASHLDAEEVRKVSDYAAALKGAQEMAKIDPSVATKPELERAYLGMHWHYCGRMLSAEALGAFLSADAMWDAMERMGMPRPGSVVINQPDEGR